jgi:hypothetical protein
MAVSRLASRAARFESYKARAQAQQGILAARSAASVGIDGARETARITSYVQPASVLRASDAGDGTATISIIDHKRLYTVQGGLNVPDVDLAGLADITGLDLTTDYDVYYVDSTLSDPTPDCIATTNPTEAQVAFGPGIHYLGKITTPGAGGTDTNGSGPSPPGGREELPPYV